MKVTEVRKGHIILQNNMYYTVRDVERSAPTARGGNTTFRIQMFSIPDGYKLDLSLRADDELEEAIMTRRAVVFSYVDDGNYVFMDKEDYSQYFLAEKLLENSLGFIVEDTDGYFVSVIDDNPVALQLPQSIVLEVTDTVPELKGASATKRTKPATLSTGVVVQVPEYIENGVRIIINTDTHEYMGRA